MAVQSAQTKPKSEMNDAAAVKIGEAPAVADAGAVAVQDWRNLNARFVNVGLLAQDMRDKLAAPQMELLAACLQSGDCLVKNAHEAAHVALTLLRDTAQTNLVMTRALPAEQISGIWAGLYEHWLDCSIRQAEMLLDQSLKVAQNAAQPVRRYMNRRRGAASS